MWEPWCEAPTADGKTEIPNEIIIRPPKDSVKGWGKIRELSALLEVRHGNRLA